MGIGYGEYAKSSSSSKLHIFLACHSNLAMNMFCDIYLTQVIIQSKNTSRINHEYLVYGC